MTFNIAKAFLLITALITSPRPARAEIVTIIPPASIVQPAPASQSETNAPRREEAGDGQEDERTYAVPLILNDSVENQLAYFTSRGREQFQDWLDHSARYLPVMKQIFREYNLPEDLVYLVMIESGFNPLAVSRKKAAGPWQFMEATAREYGLTTDPWVDERRDPIKSTRAAAAHIKDLYNLFGSWPLVLASYNAGTTKVQSAVLRVRSSDFWDLRDSRHFRRETRNYVPRYMAALIIAKNPAAYGFIAPNEAPFEYDEIVVKRSTSLREIASYSRCPYSDILELNPELIKEETPPQPRYVVRIPRGTKSAYEARLAKMLKGRKSQEERSEQARNDLLLSRLNPAAMERSPERNGSDNIVPRFGVEMGTLESGSLATPDALRWSRVRMENKKDLP